MCYRKWIVPDSNVLTQTERPIESWSDFVECAREVFEENKRSFWFLNQTVDDLALAHQRCGPVDCLL